MNYKRGINNYTNSPLFYEKYDNHMDLFFEPYQKNQIPQWMGFNVMPNITGSGKGYTVKCIQEMLNGEGFVNLRNPLSSFLYNEVHDGNRLYQQDVLDFCMQNANNTTLYTCLEWGGGDSNSLGRGDLNKLKDSVDGGLRLTHLQINQGNYNSDPPPRSTNPTEDPLCDLPGFDETNYINWLKLVNSVLPLKNRQGDDIILVIPFRWEGAGPNSATMNSVCFNNILKAVKEMQYGNGRAFGLESSMYPFWFGAKGKEPTPRLAQELIDRKQQQVNSLKQKHSIQRLDFILSETGWPQRIEYNGTDWDGTQPLPAPYCGGNMSGGNWTPQFVPDANIEKAKKWFNAILQYTPSDTNFKLYYWQLQDANNGDGCGKTWGILDDECNIIGKRGGITPSPPAPPGGSWQPCSGGPCCNPNSQPTQMCPGGIPCQQCGGGDACQCP